ncbi:N-acetylmuramoyl-L-alanine amidase [Bacillus sp. MCCB 382]|uniref:N-acetylmuramoyl-L-alanine amidase n=1 Tax=Bacillus sp. MCCB 382 TaxID=2860197 RepID=UPI00214BC34C
MKRFLLMSILSLAVIVAFSNVSPKSTYASTFPDVGDSHRAKDEIYYLATGKIANGDQNGYFHPDKQVTRAEAAALIGRAIQLNGEQKRTEFTDVGSQHFASGYIQEAADKKIITGYSDGSFKPNAPVARGEMALLISRAFGYQSTTISSASAQLIDRGIAQGMSDGSFGTTQSIKRSDFSVFLSRSINAKMRLAGQEPTFSKVQYVTTDNLNFREGPSTYYSVLGSFDKGKEVKVGYEIGEWAFIQADGIEGFVHTAYLSSKKVSDIEDLLADKTIIIDPGHGYPDNGASGFGLNESFVVLDTGMRVKGYLEKSPFHFAMTRESDKKIELQDRVTFAREKGGDIFVSIHANSFNGTAHGTESYYFQSAAYNPYVNQSKALATYLQNRLVESWDAFDRGEKNGNFHVLRENTMPASLVELGFIDQKEDNAKLASPSYRQKAAKAIYLGILDYYYHYENLKGIDYLYQELQAAPSPKLH